MIVTLLCLYINIFDVAFSLNKQEKFYKKQYLKIYADELKSQNTQTIKRKKIYSKRMLSRIHILKSSLPQFPYRLKETVLAKVTAYEPSKVSCGKFADGKTSIMWNAYELTGIAADPDALPYGTVVFIPEAGFKTVDDTGSAMKKSWRQKKQIHIDLRFATVNQARNWGVKYKEIEIYEHIEKRSNRTRDFVWSKN